jgi:hypothetical protein
MMFGSLEVGICILFDHKSDQASDLLLLMTSALLLIAITVLTAVGATGRSPSHPPGIEGITPQEK